MTLTKRQKEVLDFLVSFHNKHGYSPSFEEMARSLEDLDFVVGCTAQKLVPRGPFYEIE
jgi:hypothetical protein